MSWDTQLSEYKSYLLFEKGDSANTIEAYMRDIKAFATHAKALDISWKCVSMEEIEQYLKTLSDNGDSKTSLARKISGIRSFFNFLAHYEKVSSSVMDKIETPKISRKIPDILSSEEIDQIIDSIKLKKWTDYRNRAIIEMLYGCGLRVSELVNIKISDLFFDDGFLRAFGKGNKERLVPISNTVIDSINLYMNFRKAIDSRSENLFINNRGKALSREMIFMIIQKTAKECGIKKSISPHTFRHSFATALINGGADIRMVQEMLGHESILTTEIYTHLDTRHKREVIETYHPLAKK